jgi:hypothetical protein
MEFTREDWEQFRTIDELSMKAGVPSWKLGAHLPKELVDNALDASGWCDIGEVGDRGFYVQNSGEGIDLARVADLFSFKRPHMSSKFWRRPSRGLLGNALRVVAGTVYATNGKLRVYTSGQAMNLIPHADGTTEVQVTGEYKGDGTRVEVQLGSDAGQIDLTWAVQARLLSRYGEGYKGKTSPHWYTSQDFRELCLSAKNEKISALVSQFDGCASKVGAITRGFKGRDAPTISLDEARLLLKTMKEASAPVKPSRLGYCGPECKTGAYVKEEGTYKLISNGEITEIPYVVEAWTTLDSSASIRVYVNKTPTTGEAHATHNKNRLILWGCGLEVCDGLILKKEKDEYKKERLAALERGEAEPKKPMGIFIGKRPPSVDLSVIVPYVPKTTDAKAPDLSLLAVGIKTAIAKSIRKAKRDSPTGATHNHKSIVLECLDEAIWLTGSGKRFSQRQLFYKVRDIVQKTGAGELKWSNFQKIITDHENEIGHDIPLMTRDDRGTVYHPHTGEMMSLGTLMVEVYKPPDWTYNKVLFIEKEGFFPILIGEKWPERRDCCLITAKGQATRGCKDFFDGLKDNKEGMKFFAIHDADAAGTVIYEALQEETRARGARKVSIENWGLEVQEGLAMGLVPEDLEEKERYRPVASYVSEKDADYLQTHRVELNAMTTPQFIEWLDTKMEKFGQGKLIPPDAVIAQEFYNDVSENIKEQIKERILREQDFEGQCQVELEEIKPAVNETIRELTKVVTDSLAKDPVQSWRGPVEDIANEFKAAETSSVFCVVPQKPPKPQVIPVTMKEPEKIMGIITGKVDDS